MAIHFTYRHLPASGLGVRDPRRPYVTGGIGGGVPVYIDTILEWRIYDGKGRDTITTDRSLLVRTRDFIVANRDLVSSDRDRDRLARIFSDVDRALSRMDREPTGKDRSYGSTDRDLN